MQENSTTLELASREAAQVSSALISRNITVLGKRTSIRLEAQMWVALKEIAVREHCSVHDLCSLVASRRKAGLSLTASIRIFLMLYFKAASTEDGHMRAGHGGLDRMVGRLMPPQGRRSGTMQAMPVSLVSASGMSASGPSVSNAPVSSLPTSTMTASPLSAPPLSAGDAVTA